MSGVSISSPCGIPFRQLSVLADQLRATAEAIARCHSMAVEGDRSKAKPGVSSDSRESGEYRQYRLPSHVLKEEDELLEHLEAERLSDVLKIIHDDLFAVAFLMKGYEVRDGEHLKSLGRKSVRVQAPPWAPRK